MINIIYINVFSDITVDSGVIDMTKLPLSVNLEKL